MQKKQQLAKMKQIKALNIAVQLDYVGRKSNLSC